MFKRRHTIEISPKNWTNKESMGIMEKENATESRMWWWLNSNGTPQQQEGHEL
jgi:hypothetical protein